MWRSPAGSFVRGKRAGLAARAVLGVWVGLAASATGCDEEAEQQGSTGYYGCAAQCWEQLGCDAPSAELDECARSCWTTAQGRSQACRDALAALGACATENDCEAVGSACSSEFYDAQSCPDDPDASAGGTGGTGGAGGTGATGGTGGTGGSGGTGGAGGSGGTGGTGGSGGTGGAGGGGGTAGSGGAGGTAGTSGSGGGGASGFGGAGGGSGSGGTSGGGAGGVAGASGGAGAGAASGASGAGGVGGASGAGGSAGAGGGSGAAGVAGASGASGAAGSSGASGAGGAGGAAGGGGAGGTGGACTSDCTGLCGAILDSCGGAVDCGGCTSPLVCGAQLVNVCGCPAGGVAAGVAQSGVSQSGTGNVAWTTPDELELADGGTGASFAGCAVASLSNAGSSRNSVWLIASDFGITLPAGAVVTGVRAIVRRRSRDGDMTDAQVRLVLGSSFSPADRAAGAAWPTAYGDASYGSSSDLWGGAWTSADVESAGFGVAIAVQYGGGPGDDVAGVDRVSLEVAYDVVCN